MKVLLTHSLLLFIITLSCAAVTCIKLQTPPGGEVRTSNGGGAPHGEGGSDDQKTNYLYTEQYCSVCAQMVPGWIPMYSQETTVLHHEEGEEKEDGDDGDKGEWFLLCVYASAYQSFHFFMLRRYMCSWL